MKDFVKRMLVFVLAVSMSVTMLQGTPATAYAAKAAKPKSVALNYSTYTLKKGSTLKLKATVAPKKATNKKIVWKSSKKSVATVSSKGVVRAKKKGNTKVTATVKGTKIKAVCKIYVGQPVQKITVRDKKVSLTVGKSATIKAVVAPKSASNKSVTYKSSKPAVAAVNSKGKITAKKPGTAKITVKAKDGSGKKAVVNVTVKSKNVQVTGVSVSVGKNTIGVGETVQASAVVSPANASVKKVTWSSSDRTVAAVGGTGIITGVKAGTAVITATSSNGKKGSVRITVEERELPLQSISLEPGEEVLKVNDTLQLKVKAVPEHAKNQSVTFQSSDTSVVLVNDKGLVTAVRNGEAVITATSVENPEIKAECRITVGVPVTKITLSETEKKIAAGREFTLTAEITPENASSRRLVWLSSDETVASVRDGVVKTKKDGKAIITAQTSSGKAASSCDVTVETIPAAVYLDKEAETLSIGEELQLKETIIPVLAGNKRVTWSSSDSSIAAVEDGRVIAKKAGKATITVQTQSGAKSASCTVTVGDVVEVDTFAEMQQALKTGKAGKVVCKSGESGSFEIPQADYSNVALSVDAPNATVTNYASFGKIEVAEISRDTWIEKAAGNVIDWLAKNGHVVVDGNDVSIQVRASVDELEIEMNGTIGQMTLGGSAAVTIGGTNHTTIPVTARGEGASVTTSVPVALDALQSIVLKIRAGAETSSVQIADQTAAPVIQGLGVIPVTDRETGQTIDVVAENLPSEGEETQTGVVNGMVYNEARQGISGAKVYVVPYASSIGQGNLDSAIESAIQQNRCYMTDTGADGRYKVEHVPYGNYMMVVKADGMKNYFQTIILNRETVDNQEIIMTVYTEEKGGVRGTLYDAFDASRVPAGIALFLREGADNVTGEIVAETMTDEDGEYQFRNLLPGTYTVQVADSREGTDTHYVRISFNVVVIANTDALENMTITKVVDGDQIRFVLTWGQESETVPRDLDSHLVGPSANAGVNFHTYFGNRSYTDGGVKYADLDVDDTNWEGPETTTVYQAVDGLYHFYVYDFSDQGDSANPYLASSQAVVNIYIGNRNIATYYVPNEIGTLWDVCTYDIRTNVLTPVNQVYYHPGDSENVGLSPVDIAKGFLSDSVERYQNCDYGPALAGELAQRLSAARKVLEEESELDQVNEAASEFNNYFQNLAEGTAIDYISSEELLGYEITRQGDWYGDDRVRLPGYSVIEAQAYEESVLEELQITLRNENAAGEWKASDKAEFPKMYVVTDSTTNAVEKYYVTYREYIPRLYPSAVEDEGNYILYHDEDWDASGDEPIYFYNITGENETLKNPVFSFESDRIQYQYTPSSEPEIVGKLLVTYKEISREYRVRYYQGIRDISLKSVEDPGNYFPNVEDWEYDWISPGTEDNEYRCYSIHGYREILGKQGLDQVQLRFDVEPESYTVTADAGSSWTHRVDVTYKGRSQTIYLNYTQDPEQNYLSRTGCYTVQGEDGDTWEVYFDAVELIEYEGKKQVRLLGDTADFNSWDSIQLEEPQYNVECQIRTEGDSHILAVFAGGSELAQYPVFYEKNLTSFAITDPGNYLVSWEKGLDDSDEDDEYYYLMVYGENPSLGTLEVLAQQEGLTASYEPVEGSTRGIGKLFLSYKTQSQEYWVRYTQLMRELNIREVSSGTDTFDIWGDHSAYDEAGKEYRVYDLAGTKQVLDGTETFTFYVYDDGEQVNVSADIVGLEPAEGAEWNYLLTVSYKGVEQEIGISYSPE